MRQFNINIKRKTLYIVLGIVMLCVFSLTIAYAALNAVLEIIGSADVVASNWNIHLDNVQVVSGSVNADVPVITNKNIASFSVTLTNPGDYYMFTIDVVNDGSIDAMIDSIEKLPVLTSEQAKYLNYIVEYQNGEIISNKQLVSANSFVRLKVKVEFRKDLVASDLPIQSETLSLSFKVKYIQSDDSNSNVLIENSGKLIKVVKGDGTNTGDEICIGKECFYVISSNDDTITMLSKYNLLVGNTFDGTTVTPLESPTGVQDETAIGWFRGYSADNLIIGTKPFSNINYWSSTTSAYPVYVYNENSNIYEYVENYKIHLEGLGVRLNEARLITIEELVGLGCTRTTQSCSGAPIWVYGTSYWSGEAATSTLLWRVSSNGNLDYNSYTNVNYGVRPVIIIDKSFI